MSYGINSKAGATNNPFQHDAAYRLKLRECTHRLCDLRTILGPPVDHDAVISFEEKYERKNWKTIDRQFRASSKTL
jgi:hypothetical protein